MEYECPVCHAHGGYRCEVKCLNSKIQGLLAEQKALENDFDKNLCFDNLIITGYQLNASGLKFCKFLDISMVNRGYRYKIGQNDELSGNFEPTVECNKGLFFVPIEWGSYWRNYYGKIVAEVVIPDEATVVVFPGYYKMKTNSLIIKSVETDSKAFNTSTTNPFGYSFDNKVTNTEVILRIPYISDAWVRFLKKNDIMSEIKCITELVKSLERIGMLYWDSKLEREDFLAKHFRVRNWSDDDIKVARSIVSGIPPNPRTAYDSFLMNFKCLDVRTSPTISYIPEDLLTVDTIDRCFELQMKEKGYIASYDVPNSASKLVVDNLHFFTSKYYWKYLSRYVSWKKDLSE